MAELDGMIIRTVTNGAFSVEDDLRVGVGVDDGILVAGGDLVLAVTWVPLRHMGAFGSARGLGRARWSSGPGAFMEVTCPVLIETIRVDLIASMWVQGRGCLRWVCISGLGRALPCGNGRGRGAVGGRTGRSGGPGRRARGVCIHSGMGSLAVLRDVLK